MDHGEKAFSKDSEAFAKIEIKVRESNPLKKFLNSFFFQDRKIKTAPKNEFKHEQPFKPSNPPKRVN